VVEYVRSSSEPDETILDLSNRGLLYFLCERASPTRFHYIGYVGPTALVEQFMASLLGNTRLPRLVILDRSAAFPEGEIGSFIRAYYAPAARIGPLEFWRCADPEAHRETPTLRSG
jgi:hypothetical protein